MRVLSFKSENEFLSWENKEGNTIYGLQDIHGNYVGNIREEDLIPLWGALKIVSFDNPESEEEERLVSTFKGCMANWGVLEEYMEEVVQKLVKIEYPTFVDVNGVEIKQGDTVCLIDTKNLEGDDLKVGLILVVNELLDLESNYISFSRDDEEFDFYGFRVIKTI